MVSKAIVEIEGKIDPSLPRSVGQLEQRFRSLTAAQAKDKAAAAALQAQLKGLNRGTADYAKTAQQLSTVQGRLRYRADEIVEVTRRTRAAAAQNDRFTKSLAGTGQALQRVTPAVGGMGGALTGLLGSLGPVGIGLGVLTGGVLALGAALRKSGQEAAGLLETATLTGVDVEQLQKGAGFLDSTTESTQQAQAAFAQFATQVNDLRLGLQGGIGVNIDQNLLTLLSAGEVDINAFLGADIRDQFLGIVDAFGKTYADNSAFAESLTRTLPKDMQELLLEYGRGNVTQEELLRSYDAQHAQSEEALRDQKTAAERLESIEDVMKQMRDALVQGVVRGLGHLLTAVDILIGPGSQIPDEIEEFLKNFGKTAEELAQEWRSAQRETYRLAEASGVFGALVDRAEAGVNRRRPGEPVQSTQDLFTRPEWAAREARQFYGDDRSDVFVSGDPLRQGYSPTDFGTGAAYVPPGPQSTADLPVVLWPSANEEDMLNFATGADPSPAPAPAPGVSAVPTARPQPVRPQPVINEDNRTINVDVGGISVEGATNPEETVELLYGSLSEALERDVF